MSWKSRAIVLLAAIVAAVVAGSPSMAIAQAADQSASERWAGTWEGKLDGLPSVTLKVTQGGGAVQGQVSFNLIKRVEGGDPTIAGTMTVAMVNPHIEGNGLVFQVLREDRGGDPSTRAVLNFTLTPKGERSARLERTPGPEEALEVDMFRIE